MRFRPIPPLVSLAPILLSLAACSAPDEPEDGPPAGSLVGQPDAPFPERLSDIGLFKNVAEQTPYSVAVGYEPVWPLWSNGSFKQRYIVVPDGERIDTSSSERWSFPVGTLLFKTFRFESGGTVRPIETRVMRHAETGWEFASYLWNDASSDATLLASKTATFVKVAFEGNAFEHGVPSTLQCRQCHESGVTRVLGFSELQLNSKAVGNADQLGVLEDLFSDPAASPAHVDEPSAAATQVVGYMQGNCAHCHNGGTGPSASFDLRPDVALVNTVNVPTQSSASAAGIRIKPGDPQGSILFQAVSQQGANPDVKVMPPVGVELADAAFIEQLRAFIEALP